MAKPLLLIDGNSLTYRAFFALPTDMATASGQVTNAVFGFTSMLINLLRDHDPSGVAIAFDLPEPTFRHVANPEYKANRDAAPDILRQQMGLVREVVERYCADFRDRVGAIDGVGVRDRLLAYAALFDEPAARRLLCLCGSIATEWPSIAPDIRSEVERFFAEQREWLVRELEHARADHQLVAAFDATATADMLLAAFEGSTLTARATGDATMARRSAETLLALFDGAAELGRSGRACD